MRERSGFVVIANRLPVDRRDEPDGSITWSPSPGGLVAAMEPVMRRHRGEFEWLCQGPNQFLTRPSGWPETRYEAKARRKGHEVWYFRYRRV